MICSKLLLPLPTHNDYELEPLMRNLEYTIYIKKSKVKHDNEIEALSLTENPTQEDISLFKDYYIELGEYYMTPNKTYDTCYFKPLSDWNYNDDEKNYLGSNVKLELLRRLHKLLENDNELSNFSFFLMLSQQDEQTKQLSVLPYYIYCDPKKAKDELKNQYENHNNSQEQDNLNTLMEYYLENINIANSNYLNNKKNIRTFLQSQVVINIEKATYIIEQKINEIN
ncbi:hypothetical protein [Metamycoplasma neophronis]|uniref:Uncharacterized protein n=1 Tax=Metamycoplasma neophronis TaxID=872983 RepID=A0ABY2Z3F9_9BACT|nr:hypothetical protein [Metamycoplasma neophronis]TPR53261.1 hypothetical protein FJR74_02860 [Metamycoplasma neophronis]